MSKTVWLALVLLVLTACAAPVEPTLAVLNPWPMSTEVRTATPSPSLPPLLSPTAAPTAIPTITLASPTPTAPPRPALRQLTSGGCCTRPFWSPDGRFVLFIDRPASRPVGIYGVDVSRFGPPTLVSRRVLPTSGDGRFYFYPDGNTTVVERVDTGERYVIRNGGRLVSISPDGRRLLWQVTEQHGDFDRRASQTWVANIDGSEARLVAETVGMGSSQWVDAERVLLVGLPDQGRPLVLISVLTLGDGPDDDRYLELAHVSRPRGTVVSPRGSWLVYYLTFQADAADDGLWIVPTDASLPPRKLAFFGSYRWRDDTHLLYVPLEPGAASHTLWEYDVTTGVSRRLTDPERTPFKIANNDWAVSPDGRYVVFVSAADHNLWLIELGD